MTWDDEAIKNMGFDAEQGKTFEDWQKQMTTA
jgi:hypothetical protein